MARDGSGTFSLPSGNPVVTDTAIDSSDHNSTLTEIATALTNSMARNGEGVPTADIPFGTNKITGLKIATAVADAMSLANQQAQTAVYSATVGGTVDVITITPSPAITAYAAGNRFTFIASGANTGSVTINVNALGAKAVTKRGATALIANDILNNALITVEYDGTQFQMLTPAGTVAAGSMSTQDSDSVSITGGTMAGVTITNGSITGMTDIVVADGGTGLSTHTANAVLIGEGSSNISSVSPGTSGNVLTSNGTVWQSTAGGLTEASKAQQETGTSSVVTVTPAVQQHHFTSAKCLVKHGVTGNILGDSLNITSVTDTSTGVASVTWATDFDSANYICVHTAGDGLGIYHQTQSMAAGSITTICLRETLTPFDPDDYSVAAWGKQV